MSHSRSSVLMACALLAAIAGHAACGSGDVVAASTPTGGSVGGAASSGGASSAGGAGGASSLGGHGGAPDCAAFVPLATHAELATSPRDDADAEWLAGEAGDTLVASPAVYDRARRDLAAIRTQHAALAEIHPRVRTELMVKLDDPSRALAAEGHFDGWTCANLAYEVKSVGVLESGWAWFELPDRRLRYDLLAAQYGEIPGIVAAGASEGARDSSDVCLSIAGSTYSYVFVEAKALSASDCDAICGHHRFLGFTTDAAGTVTPLGEYEVGRDAGAPDPPDWLLALEGCRKRLYTCEYSDRCGPTK